MLATKTLRNTALLAALACAMTSQPKSVAEEYRLSHNQDYGVMLNYTRLLVAYDQLPEAATPLSEVDEAKFANQWTQLTLAGKNVEAVWQRTFQRDPLLQRALAAYNRCRDLEWQFQTLRSGIRKKYGFEKYNEFEKLGSDWVKTDGKPWLDLEDKHFVSLCLWWESIVHAGEEIQSIDDIPVGHFPPGFCQWLMNTEPYASKVINNAERLNEARAVEIYRAGIRHERLINSATHKQIDQSLSLPPGMRLCLKLQMEVQYLYMIGESYLQTSLPRHPEITKAEAEFERQLGQIAEIRPDALVALHRANKASLEKQIESQKLRQQALLMALKPGQQSVLK